jgi:hypothetical protein
MTPDKRMLVKATLLAIVLCLTAHGQSSPAYQSSIDPIELKNLRWQLLPKEIADVYSGPDGRAWYVLRHPKTASPSLTVQQSVANEFSAKSPRLYGVYPALFGPGKMVWFTPIGTHILWGYDGKRWTRKRAERRGRFVGVCPNHYRDAATSPNVVIGDTALFPDQHGVHTFRDGSWDYLKLTDTPAKKRKGSWAFPRLIAESDGKGALAFMQEDGKLQIWRWRNRDWRPLVWDGVAEARAAHLLPVSDGIWLLKDDGHVAFLTYGKRPASAFSKLLPQLGAADYKVRKKATEDMMDLGVLIRHDVESAIAKAKDPEVRIRLRQVLETMKGTTRHFDIMGVYGVFNARLWFRADDGVALIMTDEIVHENKSIRNALLKVNGRGTITHIADPALTIFVKEGIPTTAPPLVWKKNEALWLSGVVKAWGASMLDMKERRVTWQLPDADYAIIRTVSPDGTVFAAKPDKSGVKSSPIGVFQIKVSAKPTP